jgi:hypothetical protein
MYLLLIGFIASVKRPESPTVSRPHHPDITDDHPAVALVGWYVFTWNAVPLATRRLRDRGVEQ